MNLRPFTQVLGVPWFYGSTKPVNNKWTSAEDEMIKAHYPTMHTGELAEKITEMFGFDRDAKGIVARAKILGVRKMVIIRKRGDKISVVAKSKSSKETISHKVWTKEEENLLKELYPHHASEELAEIIGHPINAIRCKGGELGLKKTQETLLRARKKGER